MHDDEDAARKLAGGTLDLFVESWFGAGEVRSIDARSTGGLPSLIMGSNFCEPPALCAVFA